MFFERDRRQQHVYIRSHGARKGEQVGPYEVLGPLGAGGMGEVFRARDTRLGRDVALKVIGGAAADVEKVRRFEQEARAAGALNHPNVLAVYDVGTHAGAPFLVTELFEEQTLRERLTGGALPVRKALEVAIQISHGLAAAHEKGIVHRDLKPANLFVTPEGRVKILDFGLAKLLGATASNPDGTLTDGTQSGAVLGSVGYMAPEQVRGEPADARSDLFSLGVVLYELLCGKRAFDGATAVEVGYATLTREAAALPPEVPAAVARLVRRCLEKSPAERFQSARDLGFALEAFLEGPVSGAQVLAASPAHVWRRPMAAAVVGALVASGAAIAIFKIEASARTAVPVAVSTPPTTAELPSFHRITFRAGAVVRARFLPDGKSIDFAAAWGNERLRVYSTSSEGPAARPASEPDVSLFAVSGTGELAVGVGRRANADIYEPRTLSRVAGDGYTPKAVLTDVTDADWSPDGSGLAVVHHVGDVDRLEYPIGKVLRETPGWFDSIRVSPDGQWVSFSDHPVLGDTFGRVRVIDREGRERAHSEESWGVLGTAWAPDSREVWFSMAEKGTLSMSTLAALSLDGRQRLLLRSHEMMKLEDVGADGRALVTTGVARIQMAGKLPTSSEERDLSWLDGTEAAGISADGRTVLFNEGMEGGGFDYAIFARVTDGSSPFALGAGHAIALSPDGKLAVAVADIQSTQLALVPVGPGERRLLPAGPIVRYARTRAAWAADGKQVYFAANAAGEATRTWVQEVAAGPPRPITPTGWSVQALSPDGKLLVASSDDPPRLAFYSTSGGEARALVGTLPGDLAMGFGADGKVLYVVPPSLNSPWQVDRIHLDSGKREHWRKLAPSLTGGVWLASIPVLTPDAASYAYSYTRRSEVLYLVRGLR